MSPPVFLKQWRTAKGLSYRELVKRSGVALSGIQQIEAGTRSPTVDTLDRLASAMEVDFVSLFQKPVERAGTRRKRKLGEGIGHGQDRKA